MHCKLFQYIHVNQVNLYNYYYNIYLSHRVEFRYKPSASECVKTIQNGSESYLYHYKYINAIYFNIKDQ